MRFLLQLRFLSLVFFTLLPATASGAPKVLLIWDVNDANTTSLKNAVTNAGYEVTLSATSETGYNGANPSPAGFDAVIHLNGTTHSEDMPIAGQDALVSFVQNGGGFIHGEWNAYDISVGLLKKMRELTLFDRQSGQFDPTVTLVPAQASHPVVAGLPSSFTIPGGANVGPAHAFSIDPVTVLATDGSPSAAVAVRPYGKGRIVGFHHAGNWQTASYNTLSNPNVQKLYVNAVGWARGLDTDSDGVSDRFDNCPLDANADQADTDGDLKGDACDTDDDGDTVADAADNCPLDVNADQVDIDEDAQGDVCDEDDDGDTVEDGVDNCPLDANADQADTDSDEDGDVCDRDDDGDSIEDGLDNCPLDANADQRDQDGDGIGDFCDPDLDGDAVDNDADNCLEVANPDQADLDQDGPGDLCDDDADGDQASSGADCNDRDASVATELPYYPDPDDDGLGSPGEPTLFCSSTAPAGYTVNATDNCPASSNADQRDTDGDGAGDACDTDDDGDGSADSSDNCPLIANGEQADLDEDGLGDPCDGDDDGDGTAADADCDDRDASVATEIAYHADTDGDRYGDGEEALEACSSIPPEGYVVDGTDNCISVANPDQLDTDGDGDGNACDDDDDDDQVPDSSDNCPLVANAGQADTDSNGVGDACEDDDSPTQGDDDDSGDDDSPTPGDDDDSGDDDSPGGDASPTPGEDGAGGCGCNGTQTPASGTAGSSLLLAGLLLLRRARRSSAASTPGLPSR